MATNCSAMRQLREIRDIINLIRLGYIQKVLFLELTTASFEKLAIATGYA